MLEGLFGNKNITRILLFLFVNGKCYGAQLQRSFQIPLTPLQNALNRLEKNGLITSYYEGKTRLYQFHSAYPLLSEIEQLLKKAYTLLPAQEKTAYYVVKEECGAYGSKNKILQDFWEKLSHVSKLSFHAKSKLKGGGGWNGKGEGEVEVTKPSSHSILFHEKGTWRGKEEGELNFKNVFRWTFDRNGGVISLEHLRRGPEHPVFLFHLAPTGKHSLASVNSHLCEGDTYFGRVLFDRHSLRLKWRVIGPKKNEEIDYDYS